MCGIVGFVSSNPGVGYLRRGNFLMQGLIVDSLRGMGGTGIGIVNRDEEVEVYKKALAGPDFVNTQVAEMAGDRMDAARIAIGHNRAATIGSIKDKNCHPFHYFGDGYKREILLVHNGTLHNHYNVSPLGFKHDVDSAHAAAALAASDDVAKTLKKMKGWFVFVWWDGLNKTFNIARNDNRDIYFIRDKENNLLFGSEWKMIDWLSERNGFEFDKKAKFLYPNEHEWISWTFNKQGDLSEKYKLVKIEPEKETFNYPASSYPVTRDIYKTEEEELKELGFNRIDEYSFFMDKWDGYSGATDHNDKNNRYGRIFGHLWSDDGKDYPAIIHQVRFSQYEHFLKYFPAGIPLPVTASRVQEIYEYVNNKRQEGKTYIICDVQLTEVAARVKRAMEGDVPKPDTKPLTKAVKEAVIDIGRELDLRPHDPRMVQGPNRLYLPEAGWKELVKDGCGNCSTVPTMEEADKLAWIPGSTPPQFLCGPCGEDAEIRESASLPPKEKVVH